MADEHDDDAPATGHDDHDGESAPPLKPFSRRSGRTPAAAPAATPASRAFRGEPARRVAEPATPARRLERGRPGENTSKQLIVGRDIELKGEITSCDRLVVEGRVEAALSEARVIEVAPTGYFKGSANVDEADISGHFEGDLVARDKLTVRAQGRISGSIRYGKIVIESGGEISGDMQSVSTDGGDGGQDPGGFSRSASDDS